MRSFHRIETLKVLFPWIPSVLLGQYGFLKCKHRALVVRLMGGLGNQMFQYATAVNLAQCTGRTVFVDISYLCSRNREATFVNREYQLDLFGIGAPLTYFRKFNSQVVSDNAFSFSQNLTINKIDYMSVLSAVKGCDSSVMIDGYWQSTSAIGDRLHVIDLFDYEPKLTDNSKNLLVRIQSDESVMVNVRRTDFLKNDVHGFVGLEYYIKAFEHIVAARPTAKFYIFSDDIEWCRENFVNDNEYVVGHEHAGSRFETYLYLMKQCKHFVIPNSTFAWWAAYLGQSTNSIVIRPRIFMHGIGHEHSELYEGLDWFVI
jgi:hypothetical protein